MKTASVKKNFLYSTFFEIISVITPFITAPYLSRVLGAEGIGIQSYTTSVQTYFSMFAALGTLSYGAREIAQNRDDQYKRSKLFWEIELMTVISSLICLAGWGILILSTSQYREFYIILTLNLFATMVDITWFFKGLEQFRLIVIRNFIIKMINIGAMFLFVKDKDDLLLYVIILSTTTLLSSISVWSYLPKYIIKINPKEMNIQPHFKETMIYFIPTIATSIYTILDKTLIGLITQKASENGYYAQAEKVINMAKSVVFTSINSVVGVRISYLFSEKKFDEIHRRIENSINYILFMGFACMFGIIGVAKNFVPAFFGQGYENVVELLYLFSPIVVIIAVSNCLGSQFYTPSGKRKQSAKYIIIGSGVNLILNLVLIPQFASYGAAVASIIAELTITVLYIRNCEGYVTPLLLCKCGIKKIISGLIMMSVVMVVGNILEVNLFIKLGLQVLSGILTYFCMLLLLRDHWCIDMIKYNLLERIARIKKNKGD